MKSKDLKIGSPQWVVAWRNILTNELAIRCIIEESLDYLHFAMEIYLMTDDDEIYRARFERFCGQTIKLPRESVEKYDGPLEAFLSDIGTFWETRNIPDTHALERRKFMVAKSYRGVVRPLGTTNFLLMPSNHPLFMASYGAIHEWMYQAKRGRLNVGMEAVNGFYVEEMLWKAIEPRFKAFLYQQQASLLENTVGKVASFE